MTVNKEIHQSCKQKRTKERKRKERDTYPPFLAIAGWAVLLINDDRVSDISHDDVLEMDVAGNAFRGIAESFYSDTVVGVGQVAAYNSNACDGIFFLVQSETSNADTMAWSTVHFGDAELLAAVADGDAVISGVKVTLRNIHPHRASQVDSVCVGAVPRCDGRETVDSKILARNYVDVKRFAVLRGYVLDQSIGDEVEFYILQIKD